MKQHACLEEKCTHHCCMEFAGITDVLKPMDHSIRFSDIFLTKEDVDSITSANRADLMIQLENGLSVLKTEENGLCSALVDGKCSIYENRPTICRAYPLYIDMFAGLCLINECPATTMVPKDSYKEELTSVIAMYKFWIDYLSDNN